MVVRELLTILLDGNLKLEDEVVIVVNDFCGTDCKNTVSKIKNAYISRDKTVLIVPACVLSLNS